MSAYLVIRHWQNEKREEKQELVSIMTLESDHAAMIQETEMNRGLAALKNANVDNTLRFTLVRYKG